MVENIRTTSNPSWSYFKNNNVQVVYFMQDGKDMVAIFNNNITKVEDAVTLIKLDKISSIKEIISDVLFMTSEKYHRIFGS